MKNRGKRSDILTIFTEIEQNKMYSTIQELLFFHRNMKESLPQISETEIFENVVQKNTLRSKECPPLRTKRCRKIGI